MQRYTANHRRRNHKKAQHNLRATVSFGITSATAVKLGSCIQPSVARGSMSESHGGRSRRNRAVIDYTSCFYKNKTSRDENRSQRSGDSPVLACRPRKKKQKLSQESETSPEDVDSDEKPSECASEPLLDRTNTSSKKGGNTRKHSKDSTQRTNSRRRASASTSSSGEERADDNAGQQRQRASRSTQDGADDAQPAPQPTQTSRKRKGT